MSGSFFTGLGAGLLIAGAIYLVFIHRLLGGLSAALGSLIEILKGMDQ